MRQKFFFIFILVLLATDKILAQQWVWDEIYEDQHSTPAESPIPGIIGLGILIIIIWIIRGLIKYWKNELNKKKEIRKHNEKRTIDILSNIDSVINSRSKQQ